MTTTPNNREGAALRQMRTARKLSQAHVAKGMGVSVSTVCRLESGAMTLSYDYLNRYLQAIGAEFVEFRAVLGNGA